MSFQDVIAADVSRVFLAGGGNGFDVPVQLTPEVNATPTTYGAARTINALISEEVQGEFETGSDAINADYKYLEISAVDDVNGRVTPTESGRGYAADPTKAYGGDKFVLPGDARTWYCRKVEVNGANTPGKMHKLLIATSQGAWQR